MPGLPFIPSVPSFQGTPGQNAGAAVAAAPQITTAFWVWLIVIGVIIPGVILGSLKAGGYQFVFRRR
jgi:hypothetical protein